MHITKMQGLGNDYRGWRCGCPTGTSGWEGTA